MKRQVASEVDRFLAKFQVDNDDACWLWLAAINDGGYGIFHLAKTGKSVRAHRYSYEFFVGNIEEGLDVDHVCRVRACINPYHLEPVTRQVNLLRGIGLPALEILRTHCPQGHPYNMANTHIRKSGARRCRACDRERYRKLDRAG